MATKPNRLSERGFDHMKYYIAYGSNLSVAQMAFRCPDAKVVGRGVLQDWKLEFRIHATIKPCVGSSVPVLVWQISDEDEKSLDRYEGFPKYYIKDEIPVTVTWIRSRQTKTIKAMVYIMVMPRPLIPPTREYYNIIKEGYDRFKFNKQTLVDACMEAYFTTLPDYEPVSAYADC